MNLYHNASVRLLFLLVLFIPAVSFGITVTNTNDAGPGSLRDAIANTPPGGTVDFDPSLNGQTIVLSSEILIDKDLNIQGPGADLLTISGGNSVRIFNIDHLTANDVTISDLKLADANSGNGGAISYRNTPNKIQDSFFEVNRCIFENNVSTGIGGAILFATVGTINFGEFVKIKDSTFISNSALVGGAIGFLPSFSDVEVTGCTFVSNSAILGGAIGIQVPFQNLTVYNSTFDSNFASCASAGCGGAIFLVQTNLDLFTFTDISFNTFNNNFTTCSDNNCINAGSAISLLANPDPDTGVSPTIDSNIFYSDSGTDNCVTCTGANCPTVNSIISEGYNISDDGTCAVGGPGDKPNTNPRLSPEGLQDNGGPTETIALLGSSPAVDMGDPLCPPPSTDQRGVLRPQLTRCDIGAYELEVMARPIPTLSEWGLIAMAGLLGIIGFMVLRRKKITV